MNRKQKQNEQKPKTSGNLRCVECGESHGKLYKIKTSNESTKYLCKFCFDQYKAENEEFPYKK